MTQTFIDPLSILVGNIFAGVRAALTSATFFLSLSGLFLFLLLLFSICALRAVDLTSQRGGAVALGGVEK